MRVVASTVAALVLLGGCRPDTVRLDGRPAPGDRATYRIRVRAETNTVLAGRLPRRSVTERTFVASQRVLDVDQAGRRVEVRVAEEGGGPTMTFVVRLDRAAQLAEVQTAGGLPAVALGDLGLSEIFPSAAAAPPDRALAPGDRWTIDEPVTIAGLQPSRLRGQGRLARLGVADGRTTATVTSAYRLAVRRNEVDANGRLRLDGTQRTSASTTYRLDDGSVHAASAVTDGRFRIALFPPIGTAGEPVPGTLTVRVRSTSSRRR